MNWIFTQPEISVRFEKGEPYCHIFPVQLGAMETIEPELRLLSENLSSSVSTTPGPRAARSSTLI
jgi:Family of unknown function (DUF6065)